MVQNKMKIYRATIKMNVPHLEPTEQSRSFYSRRNAEKWLRSFGKGKHIHTEIIELNKRILI